ncbi:MAG: nucleotidyltransferase family protein [Gallionella sp.]
MTRTETLKLLHQHKAHLVAQFGVTRLALFGSTARDVAWADSDVDVLVAFDGAATSTRYCSFIFLLHCSVDLVTEKALRPELRSFIEKDLVNV